MIKPFQVRMNASGKWEVYHYYSCRQWALATFDTEKDARDEADSRNEKHERAAREFRAQQEAKKHANATA